LFPRIRLWGTRSNKIWLMPMLKSIICRKISQFQKRRRPRKKVKIYQLLTTASKNLNLKETSNILKNSFSSLIKIHLNSSFPYPSNYFSCSKINTSPSQRFTSSQSIRLFNLSKLRRCRMRINQWKSIWKRWGNY